MQLFYSNFVGGLPKESIRGKGVGKKVLEAQLMRVGGWEEKRLKTGEGCSVNVEAFEFITLIDYTVIGTAWR